MPSRPLSCSLTAGSWNRQPLPQSDTVEYLRLVLELLLTARNSPPAGPDQGYPFEGIAVRAQLLFKAATTLEAVLRDGLATGECRVEGAPDRTVADAPGSSSEGGGTQRRLVRRSRPATACR